MIRTLKGNTGLLMLVCFFCSIFRLLAQDVPDSSENKKQFEYLFPPKTGLKSKENRNKYDTLSLYDFYDMSLEELKEVKATGVSPEMEKFINDLISVSTKKALSTQNNPNIVTLITKEEIQNSGARDLLDVLRLVPGFHFALDKNGRVGLGIRGNWANEGKVLMMVNGMQMNDIYASNLYFGNEFPVDMIERIEIIRGPGSSIYGGYAEFGVINIITKDVNTLSGLSLNGTLGRMEHAFGRFTQSYYVGNKWKKLSFSIMGFNGIGQRSDRTNYSFYENEKTNGYGDYATLEGNSDLNPQVTQIKLSYKNLSFTSLNNYYDVTDVSLMNENKQRKDRWGVTMSNNQFKYNWKVNDKLKITPSLNVMMSFPFSESIQDSMESGKMKKVKGNVVRGKFKLFFDYDYNHRINFVGGVEGFGDYAEANTSSKFYIGRENMSYENQGAYLQGLFRLPAVNITAGARYDYSPAFGAAFVPRFGVTKGFGKFNIKLLVSQAYRAPAIGNIALSVADNPNYVFNEDSTNIIDWDNEIKPENTWVFEGEVGYRINDKMLFTTNFYHISIDDPIVQYYYQDSIIENVFGHQEAGLLMYENFEASGSSGLELDLRYKGNKGYFDLNYSYYTVEHVPRVSVYEVRTFDWDKEQREIVKEDALLSFPKNKFNMNLCYYLDDNISANISGTYFGERWGYYVLIDEDNLDPQGQIVPSGQLVKLKPQILNNVFFRFRNAFTQGLHFGIGAYNIFNTKYDFIQPYYGINAPLPGPSREFVFKLSYNLKFKK